MKDLIQALTLLNSHNPRCQTHCNHDTLLVLGVDANNIPREDLEPLDELGFHWSNEDDCFRSYRWGSA